MSVSKKNVTQKIADLRHRIAVYKKKSDAAYERILSLLDSNPYDYINGHVGKYYLQKDGSTLFSVCSYEQGGIANGIRVYKFGFVNKFHLTAKNLYEIMTTNISKEISKEEFMKNIELYTENKFKINKE